jgi:N-formylglutamate amidohydrolase
MFESHRSARFPVVIHVPHSSAEIPADVGARLALSRAELQRELLAMTDRYTDELFVLPAQLARAIVFPVSRLVVDPERFEDDALEPMSRKAMGAVYTRTSDGRPLREPPARDEREALLTRFYRPHHAALAAAVAAALETHGHCLVLDGHSFPSRPLPYEDDQDPSRPEICLGTDAFHTPPGARDAARKAFESEGFGVALDRPFAGALVPAPFYGRDDRVLALMVEVNRGLYMDEATGEKLADFERMRERLGRALLGLIDALDLPKGR